MYSITQHTNERTDGFQTQSKHSNPILVEFDKNYFEVILPVIINTVAPHYK